MSYNMESDRRSTVSSFYGGRKSPFDALNVEGDIPVTTPLDPRARHDDASSFFNPQRASRASADLLSPSAGYNRMSYFDAGREAPVKPGRDEEEGADDFDPSTLVGSGAAGRDWDVYADFNNAGPRYSTAFGKQDTGYQQLPPQTPDLKPEGDGSSTLGRVELVTVPALGAEWRRDELKGMTKAGRKELKDEHRLRKWRQWTRDQRGCCGKWGTRKQIVIGMFIICSIIGLVLAFTIPRVPGFTFNSASPLINDTSTPPDPQFFRAPANFSFNSAVDLKIDTSSNFIPMKFTHINAQVFDLDTGRQVGTGNITGKTIPAKAFTEIALPLNFTYVASNDTDQTWMNWYGACRNTAAYVDGMRPGLNFRLVLQMGIVGLVNQPTASTQISDVNCPIELPLNSV